MFKILEGVVGSTAYGLKALDDDERLWSVYKRYQIPMLHVMSC